MMLDLRSIANGAIQAVNPDTAVRWLQSDGYTVNENYEQVPKYKEQSVLANIQSLSGKDLQHPDFMNMQGTLRKVYMHGDIGAISRPDAEGGDMLVFPQTPGGDGCLWLVTHVMEVWPLWALVVVTLQNDSPPPVPETPPETEPIEA